MNKKFETIDFVEGIFSKRNTGSSTAPTGTEVSWTPSEEFFTHTSIEENKLKELLNTIVCLCPGLEINLIINGKKEVYLSKHGLNDLVDAAVKDKELH